MQHKDLPHAIINMADRGNPIKERKLSGSTHQCCQKQLWILTTLPVARAFLSRTIAVANHIKSNALPYDYSASSRSHEELLLEEDFAIFVCTSTDTLSSFKPR